MLGCNRLDSKTIKIACGVSCGGYVVSGVIWTKEFIPHGLPNAVKVGYPYLIEKSARCCREGLVFSA